MRVHLGCVDCDEKDVRAVVVTPEKIRDCEVFAELIEQVDESIAKIYADGAYICLDCGKSVVNYQPLNAIAF
jgi:hypothetical protein